MALVTGGGAKAHARHDKSVHLTDTIRHSARSGLVSLNSITVLYPVALGAMFSTYVSPVAMSSPLLKKPHSTLVVPTRFDVPFLTEMYSAG